MIRDHSRGYDPLVTASAEWRRQGGPEIVGDRRSLQDFESYPVEELARCYDLIVIDHRSLYISDTAIAGDSTLFHAINRNKESVAADLKNADDLAFFDHLLARVSRDAVKQVNAARLADGTNAHWMAYLRADDIWCAPVLNWEGLLESEAFDRLDMLQTIGRAGAQLETTHSPLRVDGARPATARGAPAVGEHDAAIRAEFGAACPRSRR